MSPPALVVFDLGGTTIHDRGEVPAAFAAALAASGLTADPAAIGAWRGASKRAVLSRLVADQCPSLDAGQRRALVESAYARFCEVLTDRLRTAPHLAIPDALPVFTLLHSLGIRVALNSGFDRSVLNVILATVGWPGDIFDTVVCSDDVPEGRPAPFMIFRSMKEAGVKDGRQVAVVGDTRLDLEAGANAGARYRIGVLTGAHDRATLERGPYTHIVESVAGVPDICLAPTPVPPPV